MAFPSTLSNWASGQTIPSSWGNALEAKIGVDGSAVTTSLDYLLKNTGSIDPGHHHTNASIDSVDAGKITTGILAIARGGTNSGTALNNNRIMVSSGGAIVEAAALTNGQLLIGSTGAAPVAAGISGTTNQITVTNGAGSITLSAPQNLHTGANFQVASIGLNVAASSNAGTITSTLGANNITGILVKRNTDTSPTGNFLQFQNAVAGTLFNLDISGKITNYSGSAPTDGQLLIGSTSNGNFTAATLTAGTNITITNASGSITIAASGGTTVAPAVIAHDFSTVANWITVSATNGTLTASTSGGQIATSTTSGSFGRFGYNMGASNSWHPYAAGGTFTAFVYVRCAVASHGDFFIGTGSPGATAASLDYVSQTHMGWKFIANGTQLQMFPTLSDGLAETAGSAINISNADGIFIKCVWNASNSVDFYYARNGAAYTKVNLTTNVPTGAESYIGLSITNKNNAEQVNYDIRGISYQF